MSNHIRNKLFDRFKLDLGTKANATANSSDKSRVIIFKLRTVKLMMAQTFTRKSFSALKPVSFEFLRAIFSLPKWNQARSAWHVKALHGMHPTQQMPKVLKPQIDYCTLNAGSQRSFRQRKWRKVHPDSNLVFICIGFGEQRKDMSSCDSISYGSSKMTLSLNILVLHESYRNKPLKTSSFESFSGF